MPLPSYFLTVKSSAHSISACRNAILTVVNSAKRFHYDVRQCLNFPSFFLLFLFKSTIFAKMVSLHILYNGLHKAKGLTEAGVC